jgi:hypothetical protein
MPRQARPAWVGLLLWASVAAPAAADRMRPVSLAEMARSAGTIVVGGVTEVRVGPHPQHPRVMVTYVTLRVQDAWKGSPGRTLTFMQFGDASGAPLHAAAPGQVRGLRFPGMPTYAEGEEVLLFLRRPSRAGLTSPVGGRAGKIAVRRSGAGRATLEGGPIDLAGAAPGTRLGEPVALESVRARVVRDLRVEGQAR